MLKGIWLVPPVLALVTIRECEFNFPPRPTSPKGSELDLVKILPQKIYTLKIPGPNPPFPRGI